MNKLDDLIPKENTSKSKTEGDIPNLSPRISNESNKPGIVHREQIPHIKGKALFYEQ